MVTKNDVIGNLFLLLGGGMDNYLEVLHLER